MISDYNCIQTSDATIATNMSAVASLPADAGLSDKQNNNSVRSGQHSDLGRYSDTCHSFKAVTQIHTIVASNAAEIKVQALYSSC